MTKPRQTTKKRPKIRNADKNNLGPSQVAHLLMCPYLRAMNMMLSGVFGECTRHDHGRPVLTVKRDGVVAFRDKAARAGGKVATDGASRP